MLHELTNITHLKKFLLGGKAEIVLENQVTLNHYTFFIKIKYQVKQPRTNTYYVYCNNVYVGALVDYDYDGKTAIGFNPKWGDEDCNLKGNIFYKFIGFLRNDKLPKGAKVYHTGRCSMCNRKLTDPESIERGIGKYCLENG